MFFEKRINEIIATYHWVATAPNWYKSLLIITAFMVLAIIFSTLYLKMQNEKHNDFKVTKVDLFIEKEYKERTRCAEFITTNPNPLTISPSSLIMGLSSDIMFG